MKQSLVTIVGSYVVDLMCYTPHMPKTGETVLGGPFRMGAGGKGGNQAIAAARLGSTVVFVTKVGNDEFGRNAMEHFSKEGLANDWVTIDPEEATGVALILVDERKDNQIVVSPGACGSLNHADIVRAEARLAASDIVLVQLETNLKAVETTLQLATEHRVPVILNPAPYQPFDRSWLKQVTYLTPNETEASAMTGIEVNDLDSAVQAANALAEWGVKNVLLTLGGKGALVRVEAGQCYLIPSYTVEVKDSTGAGDAFNGGLAHALARGVDILEAAVFASAVAALSVTRIGTAMSMPSEDEVSQLIASQKARVHPVAVDSQR